jgi:hypothetical protein
MWSSGCDPVVFELSPHWKLAARWADALIALPALIDPDLRLDLAAEFEPDQIVELTATITTAIAFSKAAVAFGAPAAMPVITVPTPTVEGEVSAPRAVSPRSARGPA